MAQLLQCSLPIIAVVADPVRRREIRSSSRGPSDSRIFGGMYTASESHELGVDIRGRTYSGHEG